MVAAEAFAVLAGQLHRRQLALKAAETDRTALTHERKAAQSATNTQATGCCWPSAEDRLHLVNIATKGPTAMATKDPIDKPFLVVVIIATALVVALAFAINPVTPGAPG